MNDSSKDNRIGFLWLGVSLAAGLIVASFILSGALVKIKNASQFVTVKGYAEKSITSDLGVWNGSVSVRGLELSGSYSKLQADVEKLVRFLENKGVSREKITVGSITTMTLYRTNSQGITSGEVGGYVLEQKVSVTLNDVKLTQEIANQSTSLIQNGVEIASQPPQYYYTKLNDLKLVMLGEATKDAKARAEMIAKNSGSQVGTLKSAQQGVFQITSTNSTDVSDYGEYDLSSIVKTIKAVVTVDFFVK
jgi:hypothetical protein